MNKTTKKILVDLAQIAGLIAAALLVWYVAAVLTDSELIVPDPWTVFRLAFELLGQGAIWLALLSTLARALVAFAISVAVAFGLALLVGVFPRTRCCANAVVTFLRALPTIAVILHPYDVGCFSLVDSARCCGVFGCFSRGVQHACAAIRAQRTAV